MLQSKRMKQAKWRRFGFGALLVAAGALFLLFFSSTTSPLASNCYGQDSAFFQYVGSAATRGVVMYRDVFDTKGPYLFAIQQLSYLIGGANGRTVLFVIQTICMGVTLLSLDASCRLALNAGANERNGLFWRVGTLLFAGFILSYTFQFGNLTEEYALPILCVCQYLMLRYKIGGMERHPAGYALAYGLGFGVIVLTRITNACLICCIVLCVLVDLIIKKQYRNLLQNMVGFIGGFLLAAAPILIYYASVGALGDLWYAVYEFAFAYAVGGTPYVNVNMFLPLIVLALCAAVCAENWFGRLYALSALGSYYLIYRLGYGFAHYYQLIVPPAAACLWIVAKRANRMQRRSVGALAVAVIVLAALLPNVKNGITDAGRALYRICVNTKAPAGSLRERIVIAAEQRKGDNGKDVYGEQALLDALAVRDAIPVDLRGNVYCTTPRWSLLCGIDSCNRYCETPETFARVSPQIAAELQAMFTQEPPAFVVESALEPSFPQLLEEGFCVKLETATFVLYEYIR